MIDKPFIAEMHDIIKLVDKDEVKKLGIKISGQYFKGSNFELLGIKPPESPIWNYQYLEKKEFKGTEIDVLNSQELKKYITESEIRADCLLTKIADGISSAIARLDIHGKKIRRGKKDEGIFKLWNDKFFENKKQAGKYWSPFTNNENLNKMIGYLDSCKNYQQFFKDYGEYLDLTPEDKTPPSNIVSLYSHLELVGKIYRTLKKHSELKFENSNYSLSYNSQPINSVRCAAGDAHFYGEYIAKWIYRLLLCDVKFYQSFVRLQDLNVLKRRSELIKEFAQNRETKDYVLFFTDDFMCLFIPIEKELKIKELLNPFLIEGFIIDYKEMEAELNLLTSTMERAREIYHSTKMKTRRHLKVYKKSANLDFYEKIEPPICESCQMRPGSEKWTKDKITENLCETCWNIRELGDPFSEYSGWEEKGVRAAWIKITISQTELLNTLKKLFSNYVDKSDKMENVPVKDKKELKEAFRPLAVQMDFIKDYKTFLKDFKKQIYKIKGKDKKPLFTKESFIYPIKNYIEFAIFQVEVGKQILAAVDLFYRLLGEYFPECENCSPIKLSISLAPIKYPYKDHWRFLSVPENIINIQCPGSAQLSVNLNQYELLRDKIKIESANLSHFLHRLAEINAKSETLAMVEIIDNKDKFPVLLGLIKNGLEIPQILDFFKLTKGEDIE